MTMWQCILATSQPSIQDDGESSSSSTKKKLLSSFFLLERGTSRLFSPRACKTQKAAAALARFSTTTWSRETESLVFLSRDANQKKRHCFFQFLLIMHTKDKWTCKPARIKFMQHRTHPSIQFIHPHVSRRLCMRRTPSKKRNPLQPRKKKRGKKK